MLRSEAPMLIHLLQLTSQTTQSLLIVLPTVLTATIVNSQART